MTYSYLIKQIELKLMYWKRSNPNCNGNRRDKVALRTNSIKKMSNWSYQTKDSLSMCTIFLLHGKTKLCRTKPSTGPHAGRGLDIAGLRRDDGK